MMSFDAEGVKKFFDRQSDYSRRRGLVHPQEDRKIIQFIKELNKRSLVAVEVGGGSGYLLEVVARNAHFELMVNCELSYGVYKDQAGKDIELIGTNALSLGLSDSSADIVIAKNLLHHLVGSTRTESLALAKRAIAEFTRVLKAGGAIILVEQFHKYKLISALIFRISRLFSRFGIRIERLGINRGVVVSFLTPGEILAFLQEQQYSLLKWSCNDVPIPVSLRVALLLNGVGRLLVIAEKPAAADSKGKGVTRTPDQADGN